MLTQVTVLLMFQSFYTPRAKWCSPLHRWPGSVRSRPHQRALWECRRCDQHAERRLLRRCGRTALPRHPSGKPLRSPPVAFLHRLSAWPHSPPQQPELQHGQPSGAGGTRWCGPGSEGHGGRPNLRPLHGEQYGISWLPHQPRLMAGWDGPFPVLSLKCGKKTNKNTVGIHQSGIRRLFTFLSITLHGWCVLWCWVKRRRERRSVTLSSSAVVIGEGVAGLRCV